LIRAITCGANPVQRTSCSRWLHIVGLCLCIALSMHAHKDDQGPPCLDEPGQHERQAPVKASSVEPYYFTVVKDASMKHALDPKLIATIIFVESGGNQTAVSPKGAKGLMQLTPALYRQYGVDDPFDIEQNIHIGTAYFAFLLDKFDGHLVHALAAYNCGPARVAKYNGLPPIKETRDYVKRVLDFYQKEGFSAGPSSRQS
jgi:soluble lytic murein transglycosylase-like protein